VKGGNGEGGEEKNGGGKKQKITDLKDETNRKGSVHCGKKERTRTELGRGKKKGGEELRGVKV